MKKRVAAALLSLASAGASAATYGFVAQPYDVLIDFFGPCNTPICANFTPAMQAQGSFTTGANLAPGLLGQEITPLLTAWSFSDGLVTYSSADPQSRMFSIFVSTDAAGAITNFQMEVQRWRLPGAHPGGDRYDFMIYNGGTVSASNNFVCVAGGVNSFVNGTPDTCTGNADDQNSSGAVRFVSPLPAVVVPPPAAGPVAVPSLGGWLALALALAMAASGLRAIRRQAMVRGRL